MESWGSSGELYVNMMFLILKASHNIYKTVCTLCVLMWTKACWNLKVKVNFRIHRSVFCYPFAVTFLSCSLTCYMSCFLHSCYDLHHNVLRSGFSPPVLGKTNHLTLRPSMPLLHLLLLLLLLLSSLLYFLPSSITISLSPALVSSDPWSPYLPSLPDPRVLFVISNARLSSPLPRVSILRCTL